MYYVNNEQNSYLEKQSCGCQWNIKTKKPLKYGLKKSLQQALEVLNIDAQNSFYAHSIILGTPGITAAIGGRPKPSPCLKLFSFLYPKNDLNASICVNGEKQTYSAPKFTEEPKPDISISSTGWIKTFRIYSLSYTFSLELMKGSNKIKLTDLAYTRSGDKVWIVYKL